jgi:outer membrane murein-binding lipoprotein Lpp
MSDVYFKEILVKTTVKPVVFIAFALAAAVVAGTPAHAQQSEVEQLRTQMQALQERLDKLEADSKKTSDAVAKASPSVTSRMPITVSGLLQVHSLNYFSQDGTGTRPADTFRLRRGELRITAPRITDRISGTLMIDPAKASARSVVRIPAIPNPLPPGGVPAANVNADTRARDSILQEIQISYLLNKAASGSTFIDVGQYKIPIGLESLQSSSALQAVERALMFTQRDPFDGGYGDVRDTGVQLRGTRGKIDYRLGVFNGFGDRQNALATSDPKAVLGLLSFRPTDALTLGISGGIGNTGTGAGVPRADRNLLNAFGMYKKGKITLQGEYLTGDAQLQNGANVRDIQGYYAGLGYMFTPKIEGVLRYDYLDTNKALNDADVRDIILGLNYYIKGTNAKIQTNLVQRNGGNGAPADLRNDRTELRTNFQVAF